MKRHKLRFVGGGTRGFGLKSCGISGGLRRKVQIPPPAALSSAQIHRTCRWMIYSQEATASRALREEVGGLLAIPPAGCPPAANTSRTLPGSGPWSAGPQAAVVELGRLSPTKYDPSATVISGMLSRERCSILRFLYVLAVYIQHPVYKPCPPERRRWRQARAAPVG